MGWLLLCRGSWVTLCPCVMSRLNAVSPRASSGREVQDQGEGSLGRCILCLEHHFAGITPPMPGSAPRGQCHRSLPVLGGTVPSSWREHCRLLGQGRPRGLHAAVTGLLLPCVDELAPSVHEKLCHLSPFPPALLTAPASSVPVSAFLPYCFPVLS